MHTDDDGLFYEPPPPEYVCHVCGEGFSTESALVQAYDIGYRTDGYADGAYTEVFRLREGTDHRHMMGLAYAAERLTSLKTRRRWLNAENEGKPDHGDIEGVSVRWTRRSDGGLSPQKHDHEDVPLLLVTGPSLARLTIRGWMYPKETRDPHWWRSDWPHPNWSAPQSALNDWTDLIVPDGEVLCQRCIIRVLAGAR